MAKKRPLYKDAPTVVADSCSLFYLCAPTDAELMEKDHRGGLYLGTMLDAAKQGFIRFVVPDIVVFETTGINPKDWRQVTGYFVNPENLVLFEQHEIFKEAYQQIEQGKHPGANLKFTDGTGYIRQMSRLIREGHETGDFSEVDKFRIMEGKNLADVMTRNVAGFYASKCRMGVVLTEDHDSRDMMVSSKKFPHDVAAVNLPGLFQGFERANILTQLGFQKGVTAEDIRQDMNAYSARLEEIDPRRQNRRLEPPYDRTPPGNTVPQFADAMRAWALRHAEIQSDEIVRAGIVRDNKLIEAVSKLLGAAPPQKPEGGFTEKHAPQKPLLGGLSNIPLNDDDNKIR